MVKIKQMNSKMQKKAKKGKFTVLTDIEHVLKRPDTYGGSVTEETWKININGEVTDLTVVPMLFKVFDEALVNAADNYTRKAGTTRIDITLQKNGLFSIENNGKTIPVKYHSEKDALTKKKIYIPEMVFFRMRAGQNFDDTEMRYEGGRNGIGIKLASIFSEESLVECDDGKKKLVVKYKNNMKTRASIQQSESDGNVHTQFSCKLDLKRFKLNDQSLVEIPDDVFKLMTRRAFDIAACCAGVNVYFNNNEISLHGMGGRFKCYAIKQLGTDPLFYSQKKNWCVAVGLVDRDSESKNTSFVNNVWTRNDGHHVDHVLDEICKALLESALVKKMGLKKNDIKKQLRVVMKCYLANPTFNSQMKERMTLPIKKFDTQFKVTGPLKKQLLNGPLIQRLQEIKDEKDGRKMKKNDGKKVSRLSIHKLTDAKKAGTSQSDKCTIILTEGDSAKALAMAGLTVVGNACYGAYPLKGKILNGEKANKKQWSENAVIQNVIKILGLKHGVKYTSTKDLRYGHCMIMADQDVDGFHIRGLVMAIFSSHWPELLKMPGFIQVMKTPLVKAFQGRKLVKEFFNEQEAEAFQKKKPNLTYKYYKGLGTSTSAEAKVYFKNLDRYRFSMSGDHFILKRAYGDDSKFRKDISAVPPQVNDGNTYEKFVRGAYASYVRADNGRKIPNGLSGLKDVQWKILWTFLRKKYKNEQKVAQMAGIIANYTHYHHGEDNISKAIINMAQDFVGANNLPYLKANGQFGTRHCGGSDHAAARYIFTELQPWVPLLYPETDFPVLERAKVDGNEIEPKEPIPIIPMVLVNGVCGLGTGWVSDIPQHDPLALIQLLKNRLHGNTTAVPTPWTKGHGGQYSRDDGKLRNSGVWSVEGSNKLVITELPVGVWTEKIEAQLKNPKSKLEFGKIEESHTDKTCTFVIHDVADMDKMIGALKLVKTVRENYVMFRDGHLVQTSVSEIIDYHYDKRYELYRTRVEYQKNQLKTDIKELEQKMKFIQVCIDGKIPLTTSTNVELLQACMEQNVNEKYLDMNLRDLTKDKVGKLKASIAKRKKDWDTLNATPVVDIWLRELNALERCIVPSKKKRDFIDLSD